MNLKNIMNLKTILIIAILIAGIVLVGYKPLTIGFTTLSLSQVSFTNNLGGVLPCSKGWILYVSEGGLGQYAVGTFSKEELGKSGTKPQYDLKIEKTSGEYWWEYPIKIDYNTLPVSTVHYQEWFCLWADENEAVKKCGNKTAYYGKYPNSFTCFCIAENREASYIGFLDNPYYAFSTKWRVTAKGETYEATLSNKGSPNTVTAATKLGNYVYIRWDANKVAGNYPSQQNIVAWYSKEWKLGNKFLYQQYVDAWNAYRRALNDALGGKIDSVALKNRIDEVNKAASKFLSTQESFGSIENKYSVTNGYVKITQSSPAQLPTYVIYVCAEWLGIYTPVPRPYIIQAQGTSFKTGEYGYITVVVGNDGDNGNIDVWATCDSPISAEPVKTYGINKGEIKTIYIKVTASTSTEISAYCTVYVRSLTYTDSRKVIVSVSPQRICEPNQMICDVGNVIKKCNSAGSGWETVQVCSATQYCAYENGIPKCFEKTPSPSPSLPAPSLPSPSLPSPGGECEWWNIACKIERFVAGVKTFFFMLSLVLSGLGALMVLAIGREKFVRHEKDYVGWAIIVGLAIFTGLLIYNTWWIFVIVLVAYYIIKNLLPGRKML